ncbi:hypothetical protein [Okeania sp. SIO2B3]|nr:hypothetical protein [Okeania sp. SIO2B3]
MLQYPPTEGEWNLDKLIERWVELGMPETEADLSDKHGQINRP